MKVPVVLRGEIELDELPTAASSDARPRFCTAATRPTWCGERLWRAAVRALKAEGKVFRPGGGDVRGGRDFLVKVEDLESWVERHPVASVERELVPAMVAVDPNAPIPIEAMRRRRASR